MVRHAGPLQQRRDPHEKLGIAAVFYSTPAFAQDEDNRSVDTIAPRCAES